MPSASLQSRIQAFEALSSSSSAMTSTTTSSLSTSRPAAADSRVSSSSLLESPISPTASAFHPITPSVGPISSSRSRSPSPSTPSLPCQASLIDLKDWIVEDGPVDQSFALRPSLTPGASKLDGIPESSRTSFPPGKTVSLRPNSSTPLINFEPPPQNSRPPLPPRKPSFSTATQRSISAGSETRAILRPLDHPDPLTIEHTYPPGAHKFGAGRLGHAPRSSVSSFHSVSLSSDGNNVEVNPNHPSLTFEADISITDFDTASIAESFENVSAPSAASPSTAIPFDWEHATSKSKTSPKLEPLVLRSHPGAKVVPVVPPKPLARSVSASSSSTAASTKTRRPPPPPPPYQPRPRPSSSRASVLSTSASTSDRSSVRSNATATSQTSISTRNSAQPVCSVKSSPRLRPTLVSPAARARYESLFDSALQGRREAEKKAEKTKLLVPSPLSIKRRRQATGWRGLSVDLITAPEDRPVLCAEKGLDGSGSEDEEGLSSVASGERLNAAIVKYIWGASRLDNKELRNIWNDCDPQRTGFVDRDAFVRGMWRIDEELRRAQLARRTLALAAASSQRVPHRPLPPSRPQGTASLTCQHVERGNAYR